MRITNKYCLGLGILVFAFSTVCFGLGSPTTTLEKAGKTIGKSDGNSCFLIGSFTVVHQADPSIAPPEIAKGKEVINPDCHFNTFVEMVNQETRKKYPIDFKPVTGSVSGYYCSAKKLTENTANPYWVLEVPAGTYQLDTVICKYTIRKERYQDYFDTLIDAPVSRLLKQKIFIPAKAGQIVYIGDYQATLATHIMLDTSQNMLYPFRIFNMERKNNFDAAKTALLDKADEKTKAKISQMEFVSSFTQQDSLPVD